MKHLTQTLAQTHVFAELQAAELQLLVLNAKAVSIREGQHLFEASHAADAFFWLQSGRLRLYRTAYNGEEKVFQMAGNGDLVAETAIFAEPRLYPLSAQAESDCELIKLPGKNLLSLVQQSPNLAVRLLSSMSTRLYQAVNRIDQLTISSSSQRLVIYLLDLQQQQGGRWLTLPMNAAVLARQLNITPETLSRLLNHFKQEGFISGKRREWVLVDAKGLCRFVDLPDSLVEHHDALDSSMFLCCNFR